METFSTRIACKKIGVRVDTLREWAKLGCPLPALLPRYDSTTTPAGVKARRWTYADVAAALQWRRSRAGAHRRVRRLRLPPVTFAGIDLNPIVRRSLVELIATKCEEIGVPVRENMIKRSLEAHPQYVAAIDYHARSSLAALTSLTATTSRTVH